MKPGPRISWKKEATALACGLLLGCAWKGAQAGVWRARPLPAAHAHRS